MECGEVKDFDFRDLRTVEALGQENPAVKPSLRWWLEQRDRNGFAACTVQVGKKIFIHEPRFNRWLSDHLGKSA